MRKYVSLWLILVVYLLIGFLFASYTPAWQAPDEPAHYNYVRQLAAGSLPVMTPGDYDEAYKNEAVSSRFAPEYDVTLLTYEDWQPPLYYLLLTPIFWLSGGSLLALRLASLLIGAGVVALAYTLARRLFPHKRWVAATTAVFVAFLPQHLAIMASVNNDALAELIIAGILVVLIKPGDGRPEPGDWRLVGGLLGLGFLTKGTVYPMTAVIGLALLWQYWGEWRGFLRMGTQTAVPAFLLGVLWWGRNLAVYGWPDILGKAAHDAVVVGQPRTAAWLAELGGIELARRFVQTTFRSFWGQFGWMAAPMTHPGWLYPLLWLFTAVILIGLLFHLRQQRNNSHSSLLNLQSLILVTLFLLTFGVHVGYNVTFVQHQGRYLFPGLIPIGVGVALGLGAWLALLRHWSLLARLPLTALLPWGLGAALVALDLWALFRVIVPYLS